MADEAGILDELNHEGSALQTAKDLFAGAAGGVAQVLLGQPFDIIKVRLQTSTAYAGAAGAARAIWRDEGPLAFYKGTLTPLVGIGACVSVQFGAFHQARRWFEARATRTRGRPQLTYGEYYAAGAFAGVANAGLSGPIEHVRIRLQTQPHGVGQRLYAGPADCVRQLVARSGGGLQGVGRGLFRGQAVTVWREAQAYGVWFLTFEWLMNADAARNGVARKDVPAYKVALYGGLAGEALWLASYPFDVVKSKMQTDAITPADQRYRSMRDCFAQIWRADGFRGFWRGLAPTLLRAMPVSAGTFAVVEATMRAIN